VRREGHAERELVGGVAIAAAMAASEDPGADYIELMDDALAQLEGGPRI
jgi:hypothetical protein